MGDSMQSGKWQPTYRVIAILAAAALVFSTVAVEADNGGPSADFTWEPQEPTDMQDVQFTYLGGDAIVWMWDFGDGDTSTNKNPVHRYDDNGTYTVRLTVWDDQNNMNTTTKQITVSNVPPVADAGDDRVTNTLTVFFNASASYDPDGTIESYLWDFGDGDTAAGMKGNHTYDVAGTYTVELNVTDNDDAYATATIELLIDITAPVTNATLNGTGSGDWYRTNVTIILNATDNESGVNATWYTLDDTWELYNESFNVTGEGRHNLTYYSVDNATNREDNTTIEINIDGTPPSTTVTLNGTLGKRGWYRGPVTATLNATDALSGVDVIEYAVDNGGDWEIYDDAVTVSGTGTHTLEFRATDVAGNQEETKNVTIKIDSADPSVTLDVPQSGSLYMFGREVLPTLFGNTVIIGDLTTSVTASDGNQSGVYKVFFYLDGELLWEDYNAPYQVTLPNEFPLARHDVSATAYDAAGNTATTQTVQYLKIL